MRKSAYGFTLVEILVVIAIMAITGVFVLSNYSSFGEYQKLKNAVLDVQSFLRLAQSNATSNLKCQNLPSLGWLVDFTNNTTLDLKCQNASGTSSSIKPLSLPANISYTFSFGPCIIKGLSSVTFVPLYGTTPSYCSGSPVTIILTDDKLPAGANTKSLVIEQGGRIYEP